MQFILTYILPPLISIICSAVAGYFAIYIKNIAKLQQNAAKENQINMIREEIKPLVDEIALIHADLNLVDGRIDGCVETEAQHIAAIRVSYRYRLVTLCRTYLRQGYMTAEQFEQLNEFFAVYRAIGGNGQAEDYYNRVKELEIRI